MNWEVFSFQDVYNSARESKILERPKNTSHTTHLHILAVYFIKFHYIYFIKFSKLTSPTPGKFLNTATVSCWEKNNKTW